MRCSNDKVQEEAVLIVDQISSSVETDVTSITSSVCIGLLRYIKYEDWKIYENEW